MATRERRYGPGGGITLGGIIVIVGIVLMFIWSFWIGLIIALVGLVALAASRAAGGTNGPNTGGLISASGPGRLNMRSARRRSPCARAVSPIARTSS